MHACGDWRADAATADTKHHQEQNHHLNLPKGGETPFLHLMMKYSKDASGGGFDMHVGLVLGC